MFTKKRLILALIALVMLGIGYWQFSSKKTAAVTYQTTKVAKSTLIQTITASGQITSANNVSITIQVSGVVKDVFVKNGDQVTAGQKIATITLDQASQQKQAAAWSAYLSAQNNLASAKSKLNSLQSTMFKANQTFVNDKGINNPSDSQKADPKYIEENAEWLAAEADYVNQKNVIAQAQAAFSSASLSLSQASSTVTSPIAGIVKGLTITSGSIISVTSNNTTTVSQVLGSIYQTGPIQAQVNISEMDVIHAVAGQKVTMTLDAFPTQTFTGKLVSINTNGVVSSNVVTYPAIISFDTSIDTIYPNMAVNTKVITKIKDGVLSVPTAAIRNSTVQIMENGSPVTVTVVTGITSDTQTEIISGLSEGDTVVTSASSARTTPSSTGSVFGGTGGFGGAIRTVGR